LACLIIKQRLKNLNDLLNLYQFKSSKGYNILLEIVIILDVLELFITISFTEVDMALEQLDPW